MFRNYVGLLNFAQHTNILNFLYFQNVDVGFIKTLRLLAFFNSSDRTRMIIFIFVCDKKIMFDSQQYKTMLSKAYLLV
jgi:hypothetical protein